MRDTRGTREGTARWGPPVRVGLIGAGGIARAHAVAYASARTWCRSEVPEVRLVRRQWGRIRNGTDWIGSYPDIEVTRLGGLRASTC
ncbi:MAG TPA: hypothetical protein VMS64_40575 [Candidatus Methylomirabilis sp.]|nr:hypothetical protein [Candidatus Methylomirabilis sp.]